jgi:DNA invertase Pin-like site-specific DNA recombinase
MKKVILNAKQVLLYIRVSTDEQKEKGYSLRDQEQKLKHYCEVNNLNIVAIYSDDHSAKTFNRPEFKKLLEKCRKEKRIIDEILFIKWDRFSRNASQAYQMIDTLDLLGIKLNAIEQPLDLSIPEQLLMLAVYLAIPEVENHRRSLNITAGMRRAFKEGRYVVSPPKGYSMGRDQSNKPILQTNNESKYIQEAFELLGTGLYNQKEVLTRLQRRGLKTSKSAFARILRNPIYHGDIYIKPFKDEDQQVVKGIHEPLITKSLFDKVQFVIDGGKRQLQVSHKKINDKFPLKGFVLCPKCHNPLLASSSKGRSKYYSYYHCISPCDTRYKKEDVEAWFQSFLGSISLNKNAQTLLSKMVEERFKAQTQSHTLGPKHYEQINNLEQKLINLQDSFIDRDIDRNDFHQAKSRYENLLNELKEKEEAQKKKSEILNIYKQGFKKLESIDLQFIDSDIDGKRKLIGSMFPEKFQFAKNEVRTADINSILLKIASVNKGLQRNKKRDKSKKDDLSQDVLKVELV